MSEPPITDERLDGLLRASNPYPPALDRGLSLRGQADLERILRTPAKRRSARTWGWRISVPAVAVAIVAIVLTAVVNPIAATTPAAAQGLAPLTYTASTLTTDEAIDLAQSRLATSSGVAAPIRKAVTVAWYAQVAMNGPMRDPVISPEVSTWTWDPVARTSHLVVTAGQPYRADGTPSPTEHNTPAPGTVLRDDELGEAGLTFDGVKPLPETLEGSSVTFYYDIIHAFTGTEPTGSDLLVNIPPFLNMWTLTNQQHANLLEMLRGRDDIDFLGTTHDRAGRHVLAFGAGNTSGLHSQVLLVSADTGRIIGEESTYLGHDPAIPIPSGSVMSYELWEAAPPHP